MGLGPIVRVPHHDPTYMKKVLDSMPLPGGVLVPMVKDADMAKSVVESIRYPMQRSREETTTTQQLERSGGGIRGCAVPLVRASAWGQNPNYVERCEEDLLVMVQVETAEAVESIPDIANVPGVDAIFLGPYDLSCSIGKMGQFDDPEVRSLLHRAETLVLHSESECMLAGFRPPGDDLRDLFWERGYSLVCGSVDTTLLRQAALLNINKTQCMHACMYIRYVISTLPKKGSSWCFLFVLCCTNAFVWILFRVDASVP